METITSFLKYLFAISPGQEFKFYLPLLIFIGLLLIASMVFSKIHHKKKKTDFAFKKLFRKVSTILVIFAFLNLFYVAVRYENIPYFSMRFIFYLINLLFLYLIYRYIRIYRLDYPRERENAKRVIKKTDENQYLPHKKKR